MNKLNLPKKVRIVEVGPRDGLQNETKILETSDKVKFINMLREASLDTIEATSFVRPDRILQMADSEELIEQLSNFHDSLDGFPCLVPNLKGLEKAISLGVKEVAIFTSISELFNKKNINASIDESIERLSKVAKKANSSNIKIRGYISTVFGCPYEGEAKLDRLEEISKKLFDLGAYEISLGDTIGTGNPKKVYDVVNLLEQKFDKKLFSMHFHDTWSMALVNTLSSLECGITSFDSSAGGIGGCPYAKGATGNVATEDLLYLFNSMGIETGISLEKVLSASQFILSKIGKTSPSKFVNSYLKKGKL